MTMPKKPWTPQREAAVARQAEEGFEPPEIGPARPNPLRRSGRPSLSPEGGESKVLNARIPSALHREVQSLADRTGRSTSDLTRAALDVLVAASAPARPRRAGRYRAVPRPPRVCLVAVAGTALLASVRKHLDSLGLQVAVLDEERRAGVSSPLHVLGAHLAASDAVVVLLTKETGQRGDARQDVHFELGYALALLDRDLVLVLHDPAADVPPELAGGPVVDVTRPRFLSTLTQHLADRGLVVRADAG